MRMLELAEGLSGSKMWVRTELSLGVRCWEDIVMVDCFACMIVELSE